MRVGLVTPTQYESLVDLLCELKGFYNEGAPVARELERSYLLDHLLSVDCPLRLVVASRDRERVIGLAAITLTYSLVDPSPDRRRQCWLKELYVLSAERNLGVGAALMSWVAAHALQHECSRIDWPVQSSNLRGIAFYAGLGAVQVGDRLSYRLSGAALHALAGRRAEHDR